MHIIKVYYRESRARIKVFLPHHSIDVNLFSVRSQWQTLAYLVGGGVNFASVYYYKMWKSWDSRVKMERASRRFWSQPAAARYWELHWHSACRRESGTLKNKWYVSKNLKCITESRVLKICYRLFPQPFLYVAFWTFTLPSLYLVISLFWGTSHWCHAMSEEDFNVNTKYFCRYVSLYSLVCFKRSVNIVLHVLLMR